ncbi:hypothetical protein CDAR_12121 [Caerostris darwini]|uniref:Uncharacterized protein n=1 Tax=Caerostris darwini TaxID=1538125 RepID=A0AAV4M3Z9_9ARAC|nr:hypothetical protein CDAR_12121 [Caerostris darwini]
MRGYTGQKKKTKNSPKSLAERDSRYEVEGGAKTPLADTTTPPAESSPGCGMCVRSSGQETSEPAQQQQTSQQQPPKSSISPANCVPTIMDVTDREETCHFAQSRRRINIRDTKVFRSQLISANSHDLDWTKHGKKTEGSNKKKKERKSQSFAVKCQIVLFRPRINLTWLPI